VKQQPKLEVQAALHSSQDYDQSSQTLIDTSLAKFASNGWSRHDTQLDS